MWARTGRRKAGPGRAARRGGGRAARLPGRLEGDAEAREAGIAVAGGLDLHALHLAREGPGPGAGVEQGGGARDRLQRPVAVGGRVDGALLDDVAHDDVPVRVRPDEDDRLVVHTGEVAAAAG